jgi:hypothetical protein
MGVAIGVCLDIIEFVDRYSWHKFDLGRIEDVKHVIEQIDNTSMVDPSQPVLYRPRNDAISTLNVTHLWRWGRTP